MDIQVWDGFKARCYAVAKIGQKEIPVFSVAINRGSGWRPAKVIIKSHHSGIINQGYNKSAPTASPKTNKVCIGLLSRNLYLVHRWKFQGNLLISVKDSLC